MSTNNDEEDDDVADERQRIYLDPNNRSGDILRMIDLVKVNKEEEKNRLIFFVFRYVGLWM